MTDNALYRLYPIVDDPRYEGFAFVRQESLRGKPGFPLSDDFEPDAEEIQTKGRAWRAPRLVSIWTPQPVIGRVRSLNDYPCVGMSVSAFSREAVDALRDFLEPNGELLPLVTDLGEYHAYNVTTVVDILDPRRTRLRNVNPRLNHYECLPDKLAGLSIFRLADELGTGVHVAQPFVDRVNVHGLRGFRFAKLWPLPPGANWWDEKAKLGTEQKQADTPRGRAPIKGNTVVVCMKLAGEKPTPAEKRRTAKLLDELDAMLHDPSASVDAPYFGSTEGDEFINGESRIFLSCADADVLLEKLRPWLKRLSREVTLRVLKRYGEYVDSEAPAEWVQL